MKIGIVDRKNSNSCRWIDYCKKSGIAYKIVNPYMPDIYEQLSDCTAFMWHINHGDYRDNIFAKSLMMSLAAKGLRLFPDINSVWHFDDKIAEVYLLKALGAPVAPTWIFYSKEDALKWLDTAEFPLVFKTKCGASSSNVWLLKDKSQAVKFVNKAFSKGFLHIDFLRMAIDYLKKFAKGRTRFRNVAKYIALWLFPSKFKANLFNREKGYVYFQKFFGANNFDYRVVVIGCRAFAMKRFTRENDFRASGAGRIRYEKDSVPEDVVKLAFNVTEKLNAGSVAYDFVVDENGKPWIIEICYNNGYDPKDLEVGYWNKDMSFVAGKFEVCDWMVDSVVQ